MIDHSPQPHWPGRTREREEIWGDPATQKSRDQDREREEIRRWRRSFLWWFLLLFGPFCWSPELVFFGRFCRWWSWRVEVSLRSRILILGWISWGEEGEDFAGPWRSFRQGRKKKKKKAITPGSWRYLTKEQKRKNRNIVYFCYYIYMILETWVRGRWLIAFIFLFFFFWIYIYLKLHLATCQWHVAKSHIAK